MRCRSLLLGSEVHVLSVLKCMSFPSVLKCMSFPSVLSVPEVHVLSISSVALCSGVHESIHVVPGVFGSFNLVSVMNDTE